jgi:DHA1 family bicyclomycin/chloramphenicol resistance-like MFS transporter
MSGVGFQGNVRVLAVTSMTTGAYVTMLNAVLQPFVVKDLGLGVFVLGMLVAFGGRPAGLASSIIQPFAGHLADVLGRKPLVVLGSLVGVMSMLSFLDAATSRSVVAVAAGYALFGLALLGNPAIQATVAESVGMGPRKVQVAFSVIFFFTYLPGIVTPGVGGYVATTMGYTILFAAAALLESANLVIFVTMLRETRPPATGSDSGGKDFSFRQATRVPKGLGKVYIPFAIDAFSWGLGGSIIYGMWSSTFGYSASEIGVFASILSASIVGTQYLATRMLLRFGTRMTLAFAELLSVALLGEWLVYPSILALYATAVIFGLSVSTWLPSLSSLFMAVAPVEERGSVAGKLALFRGLVGAPAPFIGGFLFATYGYNVPVTLSMIGEFVAAIAILRLIPK